MKPQAWLVQAVLALCYRHGFVRNVNGKFSAIDIEGATSTTASSINSRGQIVGYYTTQGSVHGFLMKGGRGDLPKIQ